jgi:hypothetical protein
MIRLLALSLALASSAIAHSLEGYSAAVSYAPGEEAIFHISTTAAHYSATLVRVAAQRQTVWEKAQLPGREQSSPPDSSSQGCGWQESLRIPLSKEWLSGYYELQLQAEGAKKITAPWFVLRPADPGSRGTLLLQLATNTYQAYNNWGGFSLYAYNGIGKNQGHRVHFSRPGGSQYARWELPFVAWAEQQGYSIDFAANSDLETHPDLLSHYKLVLSVGHDEYWSAGMRDTAEAYIGRGGNMAFFSGNTCCWQVRPEDSGRALVCHKQHWVVDPVFEGTDLRSLSTLWSHHLVQRPENQLTGVGFLWGGYHKSHGMVMEGSGGYTVHRPDHWVLAGTDLKQGQQFGMKDSIVGYECDGCELLYRDGLPYPTHKDGTPNTFTILCTSPAQWAPGDSYFYDRFDRQRKGHSVLGLYTRGGTVFTTGSTDWSHGLRGQDKAVEQITHNILRRLTSPGPRTK